MNQTTKSTEDLLGFWASNDPVFQSMEAIVNGFLGSEIFTQAELHQSNII